MNTEKHISLNDHIEADFIEPVCDRELQNDDVFKFLQDQIKHSKSLEKRQMAITSDVVEVCKTVINDPSATPEIKNNALNIMSERCKAADETVKANQSTKQLVIAGIVIVALFGAVGYASTIKRTCLSC